MTRIAHLSDLHFGTADGAIVAALLRDLEAVRPGCVAVSGDVTQRARRDEFRAAREFLDALGAPCLVVPGNHDLAPLYRPFDRMNAPLARFQELIEPDLAPFLECGRVAMLGISTPRVLLPAGGRVSRAQLDGVKACFDTLADATFKVLVAHHPFLNPTHGRQRRLVRNADEALAAIDLARVDMLLAGHFHVTFVRGSHTSTALRGHTLVVQAGTALSSRTRGEANSYNVIEVSNDAEVRVDVRLWDGLSFRESTVDLFRRDGGRWHRIGGRVALGQPG